MNVGDKVVLVKDTPFASEGYISYVISINPGQCTREAEVELEGFPGLFAYESELQVLKECSQQKAEQTFEVGDICLVHDWEGEICILEVSDPPIACNWPITSENPVTYSVEKNKISMVLWNRFAEQEKYRVNENKSALDVQVGGSHYKDKGIQPIEYAHANNLGFMEANVVKYVSRHQDKNGADDIRKAIHYCKFILELKYGIRE